MLDPNDEMMQRMRRPFGLDWSQPLQDPAWRRWFDALKEAGVSGVGPAFGGGLGVSKPAYEAVPDPERPGVTMPVRRAGYSTRQYEAPTADEDPSIRNLKRLYTQRFTKGM